MRNLVVAAPLLLVAVACGGGQSHASSEADTSSLEQPSSADAVQASSAPAPVSPAGPATPSQGPAAAPKAEPAVAVPMHPVPGTTGAIDGKPFAPKLAQVAGPMQKDGRLPILIHEGADCATSSTADASLTLLVPWKDGYKVDLASLRRAQKTSMGEAAFVRVASGKKTIVTSFKPTGLVTIVSAPMDKDALGKMKIDLQSGDYMLTGDLDVKVCVAPK